jgi:hypothetical protein
MGNMKTEITVTGKIERLNDDFSSIILNHSNNRVDVTKLFEAINLLYNNPKVTVYFHCHNRPINQLDASKYLVEKLYGDVYADQSKEPYHYSEYTQGTYIDNDAKIGGHDILRLISSHNGEYALIVITIEDKAGQVSRKLIND